MCKLYQPVMTCSSCHGTCRYCIDYSACMSIHGRHGIGSDESRCICISGRIDDLRSEVLKATEISFASTCTLHTAWQINRVSIIYTASTAT